MASVAFARLLSELEAVYAPPLRAKKTWARIRQVMSEMRAAGLGASKDISPTLIAAWLRAHPSRKEVTAYALLRSFRSVCSYCESRGFIKRDPFAWRKPAGWLPDHEGCSEEETSDRHHSASEIGRLFRLLDEEARQGAWKEARLRALIYICAYLGLRKNEALNLRWSDVDLVEGTVKIRGRSGKKLKTRGSRATMALPSDLVEVLAPWRDLCGSEWVIPGATLAGPWTGGPPGYKPLDRVKAAGKRAGIDNLTILDFRHTIGTLAEQWGMGELELMRWLRHTRKGTQAYYRKAPDLDGLRATAAKIRFGQHVNAG
jgi:integrase